MPLFSRGQGFNSIRWRFAGVSALVTAAAFAGRDAVLGLLPAGPISSWASMAAAAALVTAVVYWMATRVTALVESLRRSTEALAAGDFDAPVNVDCACEIGGLAKSFRRMTSRLNANVLRMNTLAYIDPITALPNRKVIDHLLGYSLAPQRRENFRGAVLFIDLDGFKRVNDTLGHDGGDELLQMAAERLLSRGLDRDFRRIDYCMDGFGNPCDRLPEDTVFARFAGDEFVAILPGITDRAALALIGQRIIEAMAEPFRIRQQDVSIGASVGIAITPEDTVDAAELLTFADLAMYGSKKAGKARYRFFDKQVRESMMRDARIEAELRLALERRELCLHFQPKFDLTGEAFRGVEALVRWQHPQRGTLAPGEFIEIAERSGLMAALGRQVLAMAIAQCRHWLDEGLMINVAVNVSPSQFADPGFVGDVLAALGQAGVPAPMLSIEITESMAMSEFAVTILRLEQLREAGVRIALDDFGVGFSNLSQLSRLPLDTLKVDRSLVQGLGGDGKNEAIVRAIVGMAHALGCCVVAEGIETEGQIEFLRRVGCNSGQGYLFAMPMSAAALGQWVRATPQRLELAFGPAACSNSPRPAPVPAALCMPVA